MRLHGLEAATPCDLSSLGGARPSSIRGLNKPKLFTASPSSAPSEYFPFTNPNLVEEHNTFIFIELSFESGLCLGFKRFSIRCAVRFRPCIDIHKGRVKQIVGSTLRDSKEDGSSLVTNFESDKSAAEYANLYKEDGLTGGHVIMLGADPLSNAAAIEALHAYPGGLQVGGGINSENALSYIEEGASHVIVTSFVFNNGKMDLERLKDLVRVVGKERLVLDLSCRKKEGKYAIVTDRWQKFSDVYLDKQVLDFLAKYADEFLVHGVDVEGKKYRPKGISGYMTSTDIAGYKLSTHSE
ncbi:Bifunctional 3-hexulose-6-phosphate synthase/demethylmenaquinone methyltransferase [Trema orientale]|uniref:1-(5-phosphoribosyl)-5-[(5-phosphoribosylamino)methylideneamino] imidazole-4-carboxamide isomerase HISN3, chloroplastic n=1 Tax=Trema orientale TaxID=63057 RepID=A0A2P5EC23_TREOI|nr:Bifunctional 3-hexulose-6-phosphate synthase/demethylmenaquinone methyltransferase [Trema orientale]